MLCFFAFCPCFISVLLVLQSSCLEKKKWWLYLNCLPGIFCQSLFFWNMMLWVGVQWVIVVFSGHTRLLFGNYSQKF